MAAETLTFVSWVRERIAGLATGQTGGRASGAVSVTLVGKRPDDTETERETRALSFALAGPADVDGLRRGAVVRRYPAPGADDHESDRCPYVELADPSLPWRYTPAPKPAAGTGGLHPWLVLVVGVEGSELTIVEEEVSIEPGVQDGAHALGAPGSAYPFAHVQVDAGGHRTARILCGRRLEAGVDYLAVLVPAFDASGGRRWTGAETVRVPVYDHWRFRTAIPPGSFEDLAGRLTPGVAASTLGRAGLRYPRLTSAPELEVRGALVPTRVPPPPEDEPADPPLPSVIADDVTAMRLTERRDEHGRPIVSLPRYGDAWQSGAHESASWAQSINGDPRHRGVAGLGLEIGIQCQEQLVADALRHLGALAEARQRVRNLALGVEASRTLWRRRVPTDQIQRLWFMGPALSRLMTESGPVAALATADDRTLPRGIFSAAARRVTRPGPARTRLLSSPVPPAAVLASANQPPPAPPSTVDGVPLDALGGDDFDRGRREVLSVKRVDTRFLAAAASDLLGRADPRVQQVGGGLVAALRSAAEAGQPAPWAQALPALAAADATGISTSKDPGAHLAFVGNLMTGLRGDRFREQADDADLATLVAQFGSSRTDEPDLGPVLLETLAGAVANAFDPSGPRPPAAERVLTTIDGIDPDPNDPLAPPEMCVGLGRAVWSDVEKAFDEWLLPGMGGLPVNSVVSLETNPVFTDAFLCGLNTQFLAELRWRNIPVATGCTPIRRFWDRFDTASGARVDDIVGIHAWATDSTLGDPSHRPPGVSGRDLVVVARGPLFLRYPTTLVYLQSAEHGEQTDFELDPQFEAPRILPGFQGRLGADIALFGFPGVPSSAVTTHWLIFEEPPSGYRFANDRDTKATSGEAWAAAAFVQPVRVLIRGDALVPAGG